MRLTLLLVATMAAATSAAAQEPAVPPARTDAPAPAPESAAGLPVSLERIRDGLKTQSRPLQQSIDVRPDYTVKVEEQAIIDAIMSKRLTFEKTFVPAGGVYAWEQQRRLFNPTSRPLQQPYAAYSAGEFFTIAVQNLLGRYLGNRLKDAVNSASRSRASEAARQEVDQAVEAYCAQRPDRYQMELCNGRALH